jgi:Uma2 family endonuclease
METLLTHPERITFEEFIKWIPDDGYYELINGLVVEMQPKGKHEEIIDFIETQLKFEVYRLHLTSVFPKKGLLKAKDKDTCYFPDILVLNKTALKDEPLWEEYSTITKGASVRLVVEVVSTNWRDDYVYKMNDYEILSIAEYWIVDYLGLGGIRYIGHPKQPTITVCNLIEDEYQLQSFTSGDRLKSQVFPELNLTVEQIFQINK